MKRIVVDLHHVQDAVHQVEQFEKDLQRKLNLFLQKLAELGVQQMKLRFSTVRYDGDNDVRVQDTPHWKGDKLIISAQGRSIMFIEFGTGIYSGGSHPKADELGAIRGGYGKGKGNQKAWGYRSAGNDAMSAGGRIVRDDGSRIVLTRGNPANRCMIDTAQEMRARMVDVAREVWRHD